MKRAAVSLLLVVFLLPAFSQQTPTPSATTPSKRTEGLKRHDGFIPFYWDEKKGDLLFELSPALMKSSLLHFSSLATGVGSPNMFADRGGLGAAHVIHFERNGARVMVVVENNNFRAESGSAELKRAVERGFATSIIAALPIEAEENGNLVVKANPLVVRDAYGLLGQLRRPSRVVGGQTIRDTAGSGTQWRLDDARSGVSVENTNAFPLNTEVESLLTFGSDAAFAEFGQPDASALTVRQHQSFVALPEPGFTSLERDPRVGYISEDFQDLSRPYTQLPDNAYITRWRLVKKDPSAALSEPVKPITFYLDPAMPPAIHNAVKKGILWWNGAFELAGFKDAVHVEDLPPGADPQDVRYPSILWTNRSGRGWSVGMLHADSRTGEIIHSIVQLDSYRIRTVNNYWESILAPSPADAKLRTNPMGIADPGIDLFAGLDALALQGGASTEEAARGEDAEMAKRQALLAAHEVGHVLGLEHNFAASTYGRGSVMDYFAPRVKLNAKGGFDVSDMYMQGVGTYDKFAIQWGYTPQASNAAADAEQREKIVQSWLAKGVFYGNFWDPRYNSYDDGPDPVTHLRDVLPVRDALLKNFGPQLLRKGEPNSNLAPRFALVYLFHRYALSSAINVIGSAKIPPSIKGDGQTPVEVWPMASQREALKLATSALAPDKLAISSELWKALAPTEDSSNDMERFRSSAGYLYSPQDGARAIAEIVVGGLLDAERLQRVKTVRLNDAGAITVNDITSALSQAAFGADAKQNDADLRGVVQSVLADRLMQLAANDNATSEVRAEAWTSLGTLQTKFAVQNTSMARLLADEVKRFIADPLHNLPKHKQAAPPAGPPI
jgi:hypothetical protein